jgi:hypothetical protein
LKAANPTRRQKVRTTARWIDQGANVIQQLAGLSNAQARQPIIFSDICFTANIYQR